jgi:hypothetical protein
MREARVTCRHLGRFLAAVLVVLFCVTAVHGYGSAEVPAGAIASAHASTGAALVQAQSAGRGGEDSVAVRSSLQQLLVEELPPAADDPYAVLGAGPWVVPIALIAPTVIEYALLRPGRVGPGYQGRAPPH